MTTEHENDEPVLQPRCVYCKQKHGTNITAISCGRLPCAHCGRVPPVFTKVEAYRDALRQTADEGWGLADG